MMQMEGNGGCCIARWTDGGHVASGYDVSKMDEIMLKFRPIAPKPMAGNLSADGSSNNSNPRDGRHAKATVRARRKNNGNNKKECNNNNNNNNNGKKRKSSSPDTPHLDHGDDDHHDRLHQGQEQKVVVTLLPLFPEAPDLSPKNNEANNTSNSSPIWINFNDNCASNAMDKVVRSNM